MTWRDCGVLGGGLLLGAMASDFGKIGVITVMIGGLIMWSVGMWKDGQHISQITGSRPHRVIVSGFANHPEFVKRFGCPVGKIVYTHYAHDGKAGIYRCVGYANEEVHMDGNGYVDIVGELLIPTSFGYPDDSERVFFIAAILNGERTPYRGPDGAWRI